MSNTQLGRYGETLVAQVLVSRGHQILIRNWRTRWMEIDLLTRFQQEVWVVEVKTRTSERFGTPPEAVRPQKFQKLWMAGQVVTAQARLANLNLRCIVASVSLQPHLKVQLINISGI